MGVGILIFGVDCGKIVGGVVRIGQKRFAGRWVKVDPGRRRRSEFRRWLRAKGETGSAAMAGLRRSGSLPVTAIEKLAAARAALASVSQRSLKGPKDPS